MSQDYLYIGSTPADEPCEPAGGDTVKQKRECRRFIEVIRKAFGPEPEGARLALNRESHDFGSYYEVVCWFEEGNDAAFQYALRCEGEAPNKWPEQEPGILTIGAVLDFKNAQKGNR